MPALLDPRTSTPILGDDTDQQQPVQTLPAQQVGGQGQQQPVQPVNPDAPTQPRYDDSGQATNVLTASQNLISTFDRYIASGGDTKLLTQANLDAVDQAVRDVPGEENKANSPAVSYSLFKQGKERNVMTELATKGPLETALHQGPGIVTAIPGVVGGLLGAAGSYLMHEMSPVPMGEDLLNMLHGDFTFSNTLNNRAQQASAAVQAVQQNWDNYTHNYGAGLADLGQLYNLAAQRAKETDPDKAAQLDFAQSEIMRNQVLRDQQSAKNMSDARDALATQFKSIGMGDFADRLQKAQPDEGDMAAMQMITDPFTYATFGAEAGAKAIGESLGAQFLKAGVRTTRLAETTAAKSLLEDQLAQVASQQTSLRSILTDTSRLTAGDESVYKTQLARLNTLEQSLKADHATALNDYTAAVQDVNKQMDAMSRNPFRQVVGGIAQVAGAAGQLPSKISDYLEAIPEKIVNTFMPAADEATKAAATASVKRWSEGAMDLLGRATGGGLGFLAGGPVGLVGAAFPDIAKAVGKMGLNWDTLANFSRDMQTVGEQYVLGQQTLPFYKAASEKLTGLSSFLASKLDNQLVYAIPSATTGAVVGGAIGGAQGLLAGGGREQPFQQGIAGGAVIGAAGGGLGQLTRFNSRAELRQAAIGDRSRFISAMTPQSKQLFLQLHPEYQLGIAAHAMAHPDVDIHFFSDPTQSNGWWTGSNPRSSIFVNVAGDNPMQPIVSHEIGHHIAAHGLGQTVQDYILGNPITGQKGIMTALDDSGNPMVQTNAATGKAEFIPNPEFEAYKAEYNKRKLRDNPGSTPEDNYGIANEMFADLHSHYMTDREGIQKMIRGYIPSDIVSENAIGNWLTKIGMGADATTGNPAATSTLEGAQGLANIIQEYYRQRQWKSRAVDVETDRGQTKVPVGDMVKGTPEFDRITHNLDSTNELQRNPDGSIKTDLAGRPLTNSPKVADAQAAALGGMVNDIYKNQPHLEGTQSDNLLKLMTDRNGRQVRRGQQVPEAVFQELERSNQFNPNQLLNWRKLDGIMQRNDGTMTIGVYNTATKGKGRYATLAARERAMTPLYTEISPVTNQVNVQMYDPEQLMMNLSKRLRSAQGKQLYNGQLSPALEDVRTYMKNLANDQPGDTGIGAQKKGFINELFGINADANPYIADLQKRSPSVFKTYRLDRMNRIAEIPGQTADVHAKTYEQVRSFMQPRADEGGVVPPDDARFAPRKNPTDKQVQEATDVPKLERTAAHNDVIARRTIYDWNQQGNTVPMEVRRDDAGNVVTDKDNNIQYKTQGFNFRDAPVIQQLYNRYGAQEGFDRGTSLLADRLVDQYNQWKDDPALQSALGWYSGMRDRLQSGFGANIDKFANMLAATSAQESVPVNFKYTLEALRKMSKGDYNELMGNFRDYATEVTDRIMSDPSITDKQAALRKEINKFGKPGSGVGEVPLKENGRKYGINSQKVLHALTDYWVDQAGGPKTGNFGQNLSWRSIDPTIDVWAGRTARRLLYEPDVTRWRLAPRAEGGVGSATIGGHGDYEFAEAGYRQAAQRLGINPDDFQALMWFGEKQHYAANNWTGSAGATLGDFRNIMDMMDFNRYQAGLTTDRGPGNPGDLEGARTEMDQAINRLGDGVVASRATKSQGLYGGAVEPTLDTEFTTTKGTDVSSIEDKIKELAARHDQDSAFLSRIHDNPNHPDPRPIVEMGFNQPATEAEIQQWAKAFEDHGLGGFTIARDSRGKAMGIRAQAIPEFSDWEGERSKYYETWLNQLNSLRNDPSLNRDNITYDKNRYADTKIFFKGQHYHSAR